MSEKNTEIDIICLSEHFMMGSYEQLLFIPNYTLAACYSRKDSKRGGTCILVKKEHQFKDLKEIVNLSINGIFECCAIELTMYNTIIVCVYRVPKFNNLTIFFEQFEKVLVAINKIKLKRNVVITGDYNIDALKPSNTLMQLECLLLSHNLKLEINQPTRLMSGTCIDNFAHNVGKKCKSDVIDFGLSDHTAQVLKLPFSKKILINNWRIRRRDYSKENLLKFKNYIQTVPFYEIYNTDNPNTAYNAFLETFMMLYNLCFPFKKIMVKIKTKPQWLSRGIKICSKKKRELMWKYRLNRTKLNKIKFKKYSKTYKNIIQLTQRAQNNHKITTASNKSKATWAIINQSKTNLPKNTITSIETNNKTITNPQEIAESFNNFFIHKIKPVPGSGKKVTENICRSSQSIFMAPSTPHDILQIIRSLKNTTSVGYDGISTKVLKYVAYHICNHLSHIINLCLDKGTYPENLKTSIVRPIFKKDNKQSMNCYRPISLIPVISKVFEKYIYNQLYNYLEKFNILSEDQKGFRKNKTINMAIFDFLRNVMINVDKRTPVCSIYCDMTQAFDYVDHDILLRKLEAYGIRGNILSLIESYLKNRRQYTEISKINIQTKKEEIYSSKQQEIKYGVPQGSVLGPLLFIIYINDLPTITNYPVSLFADDSTVTVHSNKNDIYEKEINDTIESIINWLNNNNLIINLEKTKIMFFNQRLATPNINVNHQGIGVKTVDTAKFLGVTIDKCLNWKAHTDELNKKICSSAYALHKLKPIINIKSLITAYHGIVGSLLRFGIIFWGNSTNKEIVFRSQKRCIRAMFGLKRTDSCKPYFIKYNILNLPSLFIFEVANFIQTNSKLFKKPSDVTSRSRRDNHTICVNRSATALMHNNIFCLAPMIYNKIPKSIRQMPTTLFKLHLKKYLISKCYYSISDFLNDQ